MITLSYHNVVRHIQLCISHRKCHLNKRNRHFNINYQGKQIVRVFKQAVDKRIITTTVELQLFGLIVTRLYQDNQIQLTTLYPQDWVAQGPRMIDSADNPHNGRKRSMPSV